MTKTILEGGSKSTQDSYTGPANELAVDQSNRNLRLHNGTTPGGSTFLNQDNADARYQARSVELDGITGFEPQQRGFLVRLGPSDYRLRSLEVNGANLVISDGDGQIRNPVVGLATTITSEHQWTAQQSFTEVVEFTAGINADVAGDLLGDVVGNLTGNVTGNLTGNAAGNHSGSFVGNVDVRSAILQLADDQIPTSKIANLIELIVLWGLPAGTIVGWSGSVEDIPEPFYLCNGLNSTPDLRNKFLVGAGPGSDYTIGAVGGFVSQAPPVSVANAGAHTHALSGATAAAMTGVTLNPTITRPEYEQHQVDVLASVTLSDPGHTHPQGGQADSNGTHTHAADVVSFDNRPPYYALCFIMKG